MAATSTAPKALTYDQLQAYKKANFSEFNNAFNANNYGFKDLDSFVGAQYDNFGRNEIDTGARSNPWAVAEPAAPADPVDPATTTPPPVEPAAPPTPPATPAEPAQPANASTSAEELARLVAAAMAAVPQPEKVNTDPVAPITKEVDPKKTSAGLLDEMLSSNSTYTNRARQLAQEEMAGRGLLSSTMAAQAGTSAAIDSAKDFALHDSSIYANQQLANQETLNNTANMNANRTLDASKFNSTAALERSMAVLNSALRTGENAKAADLDLMKMKYGTDLDITKLSFGQSLDLQKLSQMQANDLQKLGVAQGFDLDKMRIGQGFDLEKLAEANGYDLNKLAIANDYETQRLILSNDLDAASKEKLSGVAFKYDELSRTSQTASALVAQHITDVNRILADPNIPLDQKQQLIDKTLDNLGNGMKIIDGIYKSDLSGIIP